MSKAESCVHPSSLLQEDDQRGMTSCRLCGKVLTEGHMRSEFPSALENQMRVKRTFSRFHPRPRTYESCLTRSPEAQSQTILSHIRQELSELRHRLNIPQNLETVAIRLYSMLFKP